MRPLITDIQSNLPLTPADDLSIQHCGRRDRFPCYKVFVNLPDRPCVHYGFLDRRTSIRLVTLSRDLHRRLEVRAIGAGDGRVVPLSVQARIDNERHLEMREAGTFVEVEDKEQLAPPPGSLVPKSKASEPFLRRRAYLLASKDGPLDLSWVVGVRVHPLIRCVGASSYEMVEDVDTKIHRGQLDWCAHVDGPTGHEGSGL